MSTTEQAVADLLNEQEWTGKIFSDGWVDAPETIETTEPATGDVLGTAGVANAASVAAAAKSAASAQREWAAMPMTARVAIVRRAGRAARPPPRGDHDVDGARVGLRSRARRTTRSTRRSASSTRPPRSSRIRSGTSCPRSTPGRTSTARRSPIGVVGVITPWNFPIVLAMRSLGPALALGNAVVLKSDPNTPVTGGVIIARIFEEAGLPEGVLHVIGGGAEVGQALVEDPNVRMISFTGSTKTGRLVGEAAGRGLKRTVLELGGNSPLIVLEDADIEAASSAGAWGSFLHQGQICLAVSRHLVHESIAESTSRRSPSAPGTSPSATRRRARSPRADHQREAGRARAADRRRDGRGGRDGCGRRSRATACSIPPTVLRDVTPQMAAFKEEIFGPVAAGHDVQRATTEAVELANATEYGLAAAVQSGSQARAADVAAGLHAGMVHINDQTINEEPPAPFGGFKSSSNGGHFGGVGQLELWTEWQWLTSREKAEPFPF